MLPLFVFYHSTCSTLLTKYRNVVELKRDNPRMSMTCYHCVPIIKCVILGFDKPCEGQCLPCLDDLL